MESSNWSINKTFKNKNIIGKIEDLDLGAVAR